MKKTYIWRGLCTLLVLVFSLTMFGQSLAFTREGDVNLFLGTLPPAVQVTGDTNYYPSSYASMDENDRTTSSRARRRAAYCCAMKTGRSPWPPTPA